MDIEKRVVDGLKAQSMLKVRNRAARIEMGNDINALSASKGWLKREAILAGLAGIVNNLDIRYVTECLTASRLFKAAVNAKCEADFVKCEIPDDAKALSSVTGKTRKTPAQKTAVQRAESAIAKCTHAEVLSLTRKVITFADFSTGELTSIMDTVAGCLAIREAAEKGEKVSAGV